MSRKIQLTQNQVAIVDDSDFEWLNQHKWFFSKRPNRDSGSAARWITISPYKRKLLYMSRVILDAPDDMFVDHISGDPLDNKRENLRLATHANNNRNRKISSNYSSQFKGVSYHTRDKQWMAYIGYDGKLLYLGRFENEIEAAKAYNQAALLYFGEFARLNDIDHALPSSKETVVRHKPTSNYPGVYWQKSNRKWCAGIQVNKRAYYLGSFATEQEAIDARKKAEIELSMTPH